MALPRDSFGRTYNNFRMGANGNPIDAFFTLQGISQASKAQFNKAFSALGSSMAARRASNADVDFANIIKHIQKVKSVAAGTGGTHSANLVREIDRELARLDSARGKQTIGQYFAAHKGSATSFLDTIGTSMHRAGFNMAGTAEGRMFGTIGRFLRGRAVNMVETGGLGKAMGISNVLDKQAFKWEGFEKLRSSTTELEQWFKDTARSLSDAGLADTVKRIKDDLVQDMGNAKSMSEQTAAIEKASRAVDTAGGGATGADKSVMKTLSENMSAATDAAKKDTKQRQKGLPVTQKFMQGFLKTGRILGGIYAAGGPALMAAKAAWDVGKKLHDFIEGRSAMQIGITSQRARFGRYLYGTNINHGDLMGAVATGRRAGVADSEVMQMMGALGKQLAAARWGEGGLIEKIGRWGGTPWNPNGTMMNPHQMQRQISQMMNRMTDKEEKLQFLYDMGYGPEKFEYFENYERESAFTERMKRRGGLRGVMEDAQIFDESGMARRADAYTQMIFKRREIQKQNAYNEGILSGLAEEYLNPEHWFFSKTTARMSGMEQAKGEKEMRRLTEAIKDLINVEKERGKGGGGAGGGGNRGNNEEKGGSNVKTPTVEFSSAREAVNYADSLQAQIVEDKKNRGENFANQMESALFTNPDLLENVSSELDKINSAEQLAEFNKKSNLKISASELVSYKASNLSEDEKKRWLGSQLRKSYLTEAARREGHAIDYDVRASDPEELKYLVMSYGVKEGMVKNMQLQGGNADIKAEVARHMAVQKINKEEIKKQASEISKLDTEHRGAEFFEGKEYANAIKDEFGDYAAVDEAFNKSYNEGLELQKKIKSGEATVGDRIKAKSVAKQIEIFRKARDYYKSIGETGTAEGTGGEKSDDSGKIGSVSDEEYTAPENPFDEGVVDIDKENAAAEAELNNRPELDFSDVDEDIANAEEELKNIKSSSDGSVAFRAEDAAAMKTDAERQMEFAKELQGKGSTWFRKGSRKFADGIGIKNRQAEAATNAIEAARAMAEEAAETGNEEQSRREGGLKPGEGGGVGASSAGGGGSTSNENNITTNVTVNATNNTDGKDIADKIVAVVIPKICDAVMSATRTGDGIG